MHREKLIMFFPSDPPARQHHNAHWKGLRMSNHETGEGSDTSGELVFRPIQQVGVLGKGLLRRIVLL